MQRIEIPGDYPTLEEAAQALDMTVAEMRAVYAHMLEFAHETAVAPGEQASSVRKGISTSLEEKLLQRLAKIRSDIRAHEARLEPVPFSLIDTEGRLERQLSSERALQSLRGEQANITLPSKNRESKSRKRDAE